MTTMQRLRFLALFFLVSVLLSGCASTSSKEGGINSNGISQSDAALISDRDPLEKMNRSVLKFNLKADRYVLKPVAKTYKKVIPQPIRNGVRNFFSNLREPINIVNDLLQGNLAQAGRDTGRFVINTTFGFFGLNDVAKYMNLPRNKEDFGQTLAVWGVPAGPYLVLPFFGPSNLRDTTGLLSEFKYGDAISFIESPESAYLRGLRLVSQRSGFLGADDILDLQPDKYLFIREGYRHQRLSQIHNGNPPKVEEDVSEDELLDELLGSDT
ncbi:MAG: VacJ family lipoprotein [Gammaproteobacteria bacterium]|nr:VacJ family lipoprotein [Gammaproteobacteria bacterium]